MGLRKATHTHTYTHICSHGNVYGHGSVFPGVEKRVEGVTELQVPEKAWMLSPASKKGMAVSAGLRG